MKSALIGFAVTVALLGLDVLPSGRGEPAPTGFEARHAGENKADVAASLGLGDA